MSEKLEKLLELITNEQLEPTEDNTCTLYISGGKDKNSPAELTCLTYTGETDIDIPVESVIYNRRKTSGRPLKCTEINNRLRNRYWNRADGCRMIDADGNLYYKSYQFGSSSNSLVDDIDVLRDDLKTNNTASEIFKVNDSKYSGTDIEYISTKYQQLFGNGGDQTSTGNAYFGSVSSNIESGTVISLIDINSTTYTDTLDLNTILSLITLENVGVVADLTIEYSISGVVYCNDLVIPVLKIKNGEKAEENTIEEINEKVSVEYIKGIIKVCPMLVDIDECIISRCNLNVTYES